MLEHRSAREIVDLPGGPRYVKERFLVSYAVRETEAERALRERLGKPAPMFEYTAVVTTLE